MQLPVRTFRAFLLAAFAGATCSTVPFPSALSAQGVVSGSAVDTDKPSDAKYAGVTFSISSTPPGATVYINGTEVGSTPWTVTGWAAGHYRVELRKYGYESWSTSIKAETGTRYTINPILVPLTGHLRVSVNPPEADIYVDDGRQSSGDLVLPVGEHEVTAKLFGYVIGTKRVTVDQYFPAEVEFDLVPAEFAVSDLEASRPVFSRRNPGKLGTTEISFDVSRPGSGKLEITDASGVTVLSKDFPAFTTWSQSFTWDGSDAEGRLLPDGSYRAKVMALGDDGVADEAEIPVRIDSNARILSRDMGSGASGYAHCPDTESLPEKGTEIRIIAGIPVTPAMPGAALPVTFSFRRGFGGGWEGAFVFFFATDSADTGVALGASLKKTLRAPRKTVDAGAAIVVNGFWSLANMSPPQDPVASGSSLGLETPLALALGPVDFDVSPGAALRIPPSSSPVFEFPLSAALGVQFPVFDVHLSGKAVASGNLASLARPIAAAVDFRFNPPPSFFSVSAGCDLGISASGISSASMLAGLGFLF